MIDKKDKVDSDKDNFPKTRNSMLVELNDEKIVSKIIDFIKL
jgi:hypothetical protein